MRSAFIGGALLLAAAGQAPATTWCVTVAGLGGEPDYEQRFTSQAGEVEKLLRAAGPEVDVTTLSGAGATKAGIKSALEAIAGKAKSTDSFALFLIGHGTFDGTEYKFNIPGPDLSGTEISAILDRIPATRQLVVNGTSASGASVHALQRPSRTVITATKSGTEKNAVAFPRYWIEALRDPAADTDKNEVVSALEAFKFAEAKTKEFYEKNKRLATEHPTLDGGEPQGPINAGRFALLRIGAVQKAAQDPAKRALLDKREELEVAIDQLKLQKAALPTQEYRSKLQALLVQLATTQAELDK
ncbi:MAG: hypothetical protein SGI92_13340 [Bryobacteraceae bacterium]|nr:hypothetical protein [Bryobacteraceae bacterium]